MRQWEAVLKSKHVPPELAQAVRLVNLSQAGVVTLSAADYDGLPAPVAAQVELVVSVSMTRGPK